MAVAQFLLLTVIPLVASQQVITDSAIGCLGEGGEVKSAKLLLVDGKGTARQGKNLPYLSKVDSIDRVLRVTYIAPALDPWPKTADEQELACGQQFTCGASDIEVCPGVEVNTAQVRSFGASYDLVNPIPVKNPPKGALKPQVSFTAKTGKFYSLLFIDLLQPGSEAASGQFGHWAVYNIEDGDRVDEGDEVEGYLNYVSPGNSNLKPNQYTFLLFEHNAKLSLPAPFADLQSRAAWTLEIWLEANSLTSDNLVAVNWMSVSGSPVSNVALDRFGLKDNIKSEICDKYKGRQDMCITTVDSSAVSLSMTGIFVFILASITLGQAQA